MTKPRPWTIDEAAILLDGFLRCNKGEISRSQAVSAVSRKLRQLAINNGEEIDEIFRNTNGIGFQMASLESAYQGYTILKPATRLFTEIVALYRTNPSKYTAILNEALAASEPQDKQVPDRIKLRLDLLFSKIDSVYPTGIICQVRLSSADWLQSAERLRQMLEYKNYVEFLTDYGYSIHKDAFVPFLLDCDEILAELVARYPQKAPFSKLGDLIRANPDLALQLKTISYASDCFYHMPYTKYLRKQGILQDPNNITVASKSAVDARSPTQDPSQKYHPIGEYFYIPLPEKYHASSDQTVIGSDRLIVVMPEHLPLDHDPTEADWAFLIQSPKIPCGMEFNPQKISQYSDVFTNLYPVFYPSQRVYEIQPYKGLGVLFQHFSNHETAGWNKLQGLIFAGNCAYIFHLIQNHGTSVCQDELIEKEFLNNTQEWLKRFITPIEYSKLQDEFREQQCRAAEAERLHKEAEERKRQEELREQQRRAAETERLRKEAEERKRQEELREQQRRSAEAERLRKEAEERKHQEELRKQQRRAAEAERLRKEAEKRKYLDEILETMRRIAEAEQLRKEADEHRRRTELFAQLCHVLKIAHYQKNTTERRMQAELFTRLCCTVESVYTQKIAEERKRQEELCEQLRMATEANRLRKEAEERRRQEELREQQRRAAEAERLRKEVEEHKRQKELHEQQLREEAERKHLEECRNRYAQLQEDRAEQERIIAENKSWFGRKAKLRKEAQQRFAAINQILLNEFPDGSP